MSRPSLLISILKWSVLTLLAVSLAAPLLVSSQYLFPFITTKTLFFRLVVEIALLLYVVLCLLDPGFRPRWKNPIVAALGGYIAIATIAGLFGINFSKSFWSGVERGEGLILLYHFFAWFLMLRGVLSSERAWQWMLHFNSFVTLIVSVYGIAQYLGASFVLFAGKGRISGTLGNAAFFAAYILFGIFISLRFVFDRTQKMWIRVLYGLIFLIELIALYYSQTRGALLGLIGGMVLISILFVMKSRSKKARIASFSLGALVIVSLAAVFVFRNSDFVRSSTTLARIGSIVSSGDITKQSRLLAWDSSWKAFLDRPVLGYGYEHYNIAFNKYFHPEIFMDQGSQIWFDRAHNTVFDVLIASGSVGLLAYLSIFAIALWGLARKFRQSSEGIVPYGILIALLSAYFFQNIFVFDTLPTYLWFFLILAYTSFLLSNREEKDSRPIPAEVLSVPAVLVISGLLSLASLAVSWDYLVRNKDYGLAVLGAIIDIFIFIIPVSIFITGLVGTLFSRKQFFRYLFITGLIIGFVFVIIPHVIIRPHKAAKVAVYGLALNQQNMLRQGFESMQKAIGMKTNYTYEIRQKYAEQAIFALRSGSITDADKKFYLSRSIDEVRKNKKMIPQDVQNHLYLISLYNAYDAYESSILAQVYEEGRQALLLSPTRPQIYFGLGQAALSQKKYDQGIEYFKKALELNPAPFESNWNLAAAYEIAGKSDKAEQILTHLRERGFNLDSTEALQRSIPVYTEARNYRKLQEIYEKLLKADPKNGEYWTRLAAVYRELSEFENARAAVRRAVELNPSLAPEAELFLKQMEGK